MQRVLDALKEDGYVDEHRVMDTVLFVLECNVSKSGLVRCFLADLPVYLLHRLLNEKEHRDKLTLIYERFVVEDVVSDARTVRLEVPFFEKNRVKYTTFKTTAVCDRGVEFDVDLDFDFLKNHKQLQTSLHHDEFCVYPVKKTPYFEYVSFCDCSISCMRCGESLRDIKAYHCSHDGDGSGGRSEEENGNVVFVDECLNESSNLRECYEISAALTLMFDVVYEPHRMDVDDWWVKTASNSRAERWFACTTVPNCPNFLTMDVLRKSDRNVSFSLKLKMSMDYFSAYFGKIALMRDLESIASSYDARKKTISDSDLFLPPKSGAYDVDYLFSTNPDAHRPRKASSLYAEVSDASLSFFHKLYEGDDNSSLFHWSKAGDSLEDVSRRYLNVHAKRYVNETLYASYENKDKLVLNDIHGASGIFRTHCARDAYSPQKRCIYPQPEKILAYVTTTTTCKDENERDNMFVYGKGIPCRIVLNVDKYEDDSKHNARALIVLDVDFLRTIDRVSKTVVRFVFSAKCHYKELLRHVFMYKKDRKTEELEIENAITRLDRVKKNVFCLNGASFFVKKRSKTMYVEGDKKTFLKHVTTSNTTESIDVLDVIYVHSAIRYAKSVAGIATDGMNADPNVVEFDFENDDNKSVSYWREYCERYGYSFSDFMNVANRNFAPHPDVPFDANEEFPKCLLNMVFFDDSMKKLNEFKNIRDSYFDTGLCFKEMTKAFEGFHDDDFSKKLFTVHMERGRILSRMNKSFVDLFFFNVSKMNSFGGVYRCSYKSFATEKISKEEERGNIVEPYSTIGYGRDRYDGGFDLERRFTGLQDVGVIPYFLKYEHRADVCREKTSDTIVVDEKNARMYDTFGCCAHLKFSNFERGRFGFKKLYNGYSDFKEYLSNHVKTYSQFFEALVKKLNRPKDDVQKNDIDSLKKGLKHFRKCGGIPSNTTYDLSFYDSQTILGLTCPFDVETDVRFAINRDGSYVDKRLEGIGYDMLEKKTYDESRKLSHRRVVFDGEGPNVRNHVHNILRMFSHFNRVFLFKNRSLHERYDAFLKKNGLYANVDAIKSRSSMVRRDSVWINDHSHRDDEIEGALTVEACESFLKECGVDSPFDVRFDRFLRASFPHLCEDDLTSVCVHMFDHLVRNIGIRDAKKRKEHVCDRFLTTVFLRSDKIFDTYAQLRHKLYVLASKMTYSLTSEFEKNDKTENKIGHIGCVSEFDVPTFYYLFNTFRDAIVQRVKEHASRRCLCASHFENVKTVVVYKKNDVIVFSEKMCDDDDDDDRVRYRIKTVYSVDYSNSTDEAKGRSECFEKCCFCVHCMATKIQIRSWFGGLLTKSVILESLSEHTICYDVDSCRPDSNADVIRFFVKELISKHDMVGMIKIELEKKRANKRLDVTDLFNVMTSDKCGYGFSGSHTNEHRDESNFSMFLENDSAYDIPIYDPNAVMFKDFFKRLDDSSEIFYRHFKEQSKYAFQFDFIHEQIGKNGKKYDVEDAWFVESRSFSYKDAVGRCFAWIENVALKNSVERGTSKRLCEKDCDGFTNVYIYPKIFARFTIDLLTCMNVEPMDYEIEYDPKEKDEALRFLNDPIFRSVLDRFFEFVSEYRFRTVDALAYFDRSSGEKRKSRSIYKNSGDFQIVVPDVQKSTKPLLLKEPFRDGKKAVVEFRSRDPETLCHSQYSFAYYQLLYRVFCDLNAYFESFLSSKRFENVFIFKDVYTRLLIKLKMCTQLLFLRETKPFALKCDLSDDENDDDDDKDDEEEDDEEEKWTFLRDDMILNPSEDAGSSVCYSRVELRCETSDVFKDAQSLFFELSDVDRVLRSRDVDPVDVWDKRFGNRDYDERALLDHFYAVCQLAQYLQHSGKNGKKRRKTDAKDEAIYGKNLKKFKKDDVDSDLLVETVYLNDDLNLLWKDQHTLTFDALK